MAGAGTARTIAVVGGGWAGIAAAIEAVRRGHRVTLFEMAAHLGGRARSVDVDGMLLDNGQHILIGAYVDTLALLETVGVDPDLAFVRTPLRITDPGGHGLHLKDGPPVGAFARAVLMQREWRLHERVALLLTTAGWWLRDFRCDPSLTVAAMVAGLPVSVREQLIEPLCAAALNTSAADASATVFLRVLKDALFSGPGCADLLLPRVGLSALLPDPAQRWLTGSGVELRLRRRATTLAAQGGGWAIDGEAFDRVVLATTPTEAARLSANVAPAWSRSAGRLRYEPIVTVYLRSCGARLPAPMLALRCDDRAPAQFVFDRGQLGGSEGLLAFVISAAQCWVDRGTDAAARATLKQARSALRASLRAPVHLVRTLTEKRATFRCTPGLERPGRQIAPGLHAAGDHVAGPYPATLEGAVQSGLQAIRSFD